MVATTLGVAASLSACDPDGGKDKAVDPGTCVAQAKAAALPSSFPRFPLPKGAVVFGVEDRGSDGTIATGIVKAPIKQVLAAMNGAAAEGFKVTSGETETHDAEANWSGNGYVGRWAIKDSVTCPGEVVIQVLARKG